MLLLLRPGLPLPGNSPQDRLRYVSGHTGRWRGGWLCWHVAGLTLLAFYAALAGRWRRGAPLRCTLAVLAAATGLAADLGGQAVSVGVAPDLDPDAFAV